MNIVIYTDGACTKNGKIDSAGGYGVYVLSRLNASIKVPGPTTNNICELMAINFALRWTYEQNHFNAINSVEICTDSVYSMNCVTKWIHGWKQNNWRTANNKPVKNKELIVEIDELLQRLKTNINITFRYVSNNNHRNPPQKCDASDNCPNCTNSCLNKDWIGNHKADQLATSAINATSYPT